MGIRVHKVLGYGVDTLGADARNRLSDPRIDTKAFYAKINDAYDIWLEEADSWIPALKEPTAALWEAEMEGTKRGEKASFEDDWKWCRAWFKQKDKDPRRAMLSLGDHIHYDDEYGLVNVLTLIPLGDARSWKRYDDILDYVEESETRQVNRVQRLESCRTGIYPYQSGCKRCSPAAPGKRTIDWSDCMHSRDEKDLLQKMVASEECDEATKENARQALEDYYKWRPILPTEVLVILAWLAPSIKDLPALINDLRPMIYTYWS